MRISSLLLLLFFTLDSFGAVVINSISGASASSLAATGTSAILFGGTAGPDCTAFGNGSTCNSCDTANLGPLGCLNDPLCACNTAKLYSAGVVTINIKRTESTAAARVRLVKADQTAAVATTTTSQESTTVTWENLCIMSGVGSCAAVVASSTAAKVFLDKDDDGTFETGEESVDLQIKFVPIALDTYDVYGDPAAEGIGGTQGFVPYPGDEKVYIEDIETSANFPTVGGGKIKSVRVFYSDAGLDNMTGTTTSSDLAVAADGSGLDTKIVSGGLDNNKTYVFRIALLDEANNVLQYFPDKSPDNGQAACDAAAAPDFTGCPWAATPEQVLGLLTDDFNCFIASAAYGTSLDPKLDVFREFRFKVLLQKKWGRSFVNWYYKYGSMGARYISDKPTLRALARVALWPLYWFSKASLKIGFGKTIMISLMLLILGTFTVWSGTRRFIGAR